MKFYGFSSDDSTSRVTVEIRPQPRPTRFYFLWVRVPNTGSNFARLGLLVILFLTGDSYSNLLLTAALVVISSRVRTFFCFNAFFSLIYQYEE